MDLLTLLIILFVLAVLFGGFGSRQNWGYYGWSPVGILVVILLFLLVTGNLNLHTRLGGLTPYPLLL